MEYRSFNKNDASDEHDGADNWVEFQPRPAKLSILDMTKRLVYNPVRNEALFIASCAERLIKDEQEYGVHSTNEIFARIENDIANELIKREGQYIQFRLAFIARQGDEMEKHILFLSQIKKLAHEDLS